MLTLPENVVPLSAEQRTELKQLAQKAYDSELGRWYSPYDQYLNIAQEDVPYIAALTPSIALGTLAYVEALEAALSTATARAEAAEAEAARWRRIAAEQNNALGQAISAHEAVAYGSEEYDEVIAAERGNPGPFTGCWWNAHCPCNPTDPKDCPCYIAPEPEVASASPVAGGVGEGVGRG